MNIADQINTALAGRYIIDSEIGRGVAAPIVFFIGMAGIVYMTATTAIAQIEAKRETHGRVLALQTVLIGGPLAIGGPILGWVADRFGGRAPLLLGGVVAFVAAAIGSWATRRYALATVKQ